ncbi:MAG: succinate dehydrogenase assembly factor 2 [Methylococcales bacterium]|nr:succinate dehydrogenase assembly factor 2 [Methylococcales bacterium]
MMSQAKLNWQCRRGTKELDRLLVGYLETCYSATSSQEQQLFEDFLTLEDNELIVFLLAEPYSKETKFAQLINKIRSTPLI